MLHPLTHPRARRLSILSTLPLLLAKVPPRGDGGVADDKDKEIQNLQGLLTRHNNDASALAAHLLSENAQLRGERRDLRKEVTTLTAKVPGDGTLVLSGDDVKAWQAYKEQSGQGAVLVPKAKADALEAYEKLGAPDMLAKEVEDGKAASTKNAERERTDNLAAVAKFGNGEKSFKPALLKLATNGLDVQMREVDVLDGQGKTTKEKRPFVVGKDGDKESLTPLVEHITKSQGEDVLQAMIDENDSSAGGSGQQQQQTNTGGITFPAQGGGKGGALDTSAIDNFSRNRYAHNLPKAAA